MKRVSGPLDWSVRADLQKVVRQPYLRRGWVNAAQCCVLRIHKGRKNPFTPDKPYNLSAWIIEAILNELVRIKGKDWVNHAALFPSELRLAEDEALSARCLEEFNFDAKAQWREPRRTTVRVPRGVWEALEEAARKSNICRSGRALTGNDLIKSAVKRQLAREIWTLQEGGGAN